MKGTSALALLASMATVNAFLAPAAVVSRAATANSAAAGLRMSASEEVAAKVESSVVDAAELNVRKPPGDVKLDQGVMDR